MKRILTALPIALIASAAIVAGCTQAEAVTVIETPTFKYVHDWSEPKNPEGMVRIMQEIEAKNAAHAEQEAAGAAQGAEAEYVDDYSYYEDYSGSQAFYDSPDGFRSQGVRYHDGRTETWYSSNQAYHYRTAEWTVDDEGYYRDGDGHYVVAASDMPEGTVFETSKGEAIVLDNGCDAGVTDFYTAF